MQPRRLALLTWLAVSATDAPVSRDALLPVFWPGLSRPRALLELRRALLALQRALGKDLFVTTRTTVGVSPSAMRCDAVDFLHAARDGRMDDARALHRGLLLPGVHLADAPEFERWLAGQRDRFALPVEAPLEPEPAASAALVIAAPQLPAPQPVARHYVVPRKSWLPAAAVRTLAPVALGVALVGVIWAGIATIAAVRPPGAEGGRVVVLPFATTGDADQRFLGEGMVDLLRTTLHGAGTLTPLDPQIVLTGTRPPARGPSLDAGPEIARRHGARYYLGGSIVAADGRLHIVAALYDARDTSFAPLGLAVAKGESADPYPLLDSLSSQLLAALGRAPDRRHESSSALLTASVPALRAYLEGERLLRAGRLARAVDQFRLAGVLDTGFALAHHRASVASRWTGNRAVTLASAQRALRHAARLPAHHQLLVAANAAWAEGDVARAEQLYETLIDRHPLDVEGHALLGELLFAQAAFDRARAQLEATVALAPHHAGAMLHLARLHAMAKDTAALRALDRDFGVFGGADPRRTEVHALAVMAAGNAETRRRFMADLRLATNADLLSVGSALAVWSGNVDAAVRVTSLLTVPERGRDRLTRASGHLRLAFLEMARGRATQAREQLRMAKTLSPSAVLAEAQLALASPLSWDTSATRRTRDALARWTPPVAGGEEPEKDALPGALHQHLRYYYLGQLSLRLGDRKSARAMTDSLRSLPAGDDVARARELEQGLRAGIEASTGNRRAALRRLQSLGLAAPGEPWLPRSFHYLQSMELSAALGTKKDLPRQYSLVDLFFGRT